MFFFRFIQFSLQIISLFALIVYSIFIGDEIVEKKFPYKSWMIGGFILFYCISIPVMPYSLWRYGKGLIKSFESGSISENEFQIKKRIVKSFIKTMNWELFLVVISGSIMAAYYPKTGTFMAVAATFQDRLLGKVERIVEGYWVIAEEIMRNHQEQIQENENLDHHAADSDINQHSSPFSRFDDYHHSEEQNQIHLRQFQIQN